MSQAWKYTPTLTFPHILPFSSFFILLWPFCAGLEDRCLRLCRLRGWCSRVMGSFIVSCWLTQAFGCGIFMPGLSCSCLFWVGSLMRGKLFGVGLFWSFSSLDGCGIKCRSAFASCALKFSPSWIIFIRLPTIPTRSLLGLCGIFQSGRVRTRTRFEHLPRTSQQRSMHHATRPFH